MGFLKDLAKGKPFHKQLKKLERAVVPNEIRKAIPREMRPTSEHYFDPAKQYAGFDLDDPNKAEAAARANAEAQAGYKLKADADRAKRLSLQPAPNGVTRMAPMSFGGQNAPRQYTPNYFARPPGPPGPVAPPGAGPGMPGGVMRPPIQGKGMFGSPMVGGGQPIPPPQGGMQMQVPPPQPPPQQQVGGGMMLAPPEGGMQMQVEQAKALRGVPRMIK